MSPWESGPAAAVQIFQEKPDICVKSPKFSMSDLVQIVLSTMWVKEKTSEGWIQLKPQTQVKPTFAS